MEITKPAVAVFALLCIGAGAGGAYLVTRGSTASQTTAADAADPNAAQPGTVEQSEAIVSELAASAPDGQSESVAATPPISEPAPRLRARRAQAAAPVPSSSRSQSRPSDPPAPEPRSVAPPPLEPVRPVEPAITRAPEPPAPQFEELLVSADSVIGLQMESSISSERARVEDEVVARVTRDVRVGDRVAIPSGAKAYGEVTMVERGGKVRDRARLGVRFTSIVLADGTRVPIETETIVREGDSPTGESTAKIGGGAIGGAIIGGIFGGAKGAMIGGSAGAGAGTAAVMAGGRNAATLTAGTPVTVRLTESTTVTVDK